MICDLTASRVCSSEDEDGKCGASAAMLEFFEIASEAWFLCLALDMLVSISNPFSTFKERYVDVLCCDGCTGSPRLLSNSVKHYHGFSWSFAFLMASILGFVQEMHGFYYADDELDDTGFCWVKTTSAGWNYLPSLFLYVPLFVVFLLSIGVLCLSYYWLRQGVSKTFQHRVKAFLANLTNLLVYTVYWAVNLTLFGVVYLAADYPVSRSAWKLLMFFISSKGFANLIIFILVSDNRIFTGAKVGGRKSTASEVSTLADGFDFNVVLREEVLHYVTTGIRSSTERATLCKETVRKIVFRMTKRATDRTQRFNTSYLLRLLFNPSALPGPDKFNAMENNIRQSSMRMSRGLETTSFSRGVTTQNPVLEGENGDRKLSGASTDSSKSVDRSSASGTNPRGSGLSFTGITDARASFTEYDVSVVDDAMEDELKNSSGGRFQSAVGLLNNLLRTKPAASSSNPDLSTLEEGPEGEEDASTHRKAGAVDLTVEELHRNDGAHSQYSFMRFFSERFPWVSGSTRPEDSTASHSDSGHATERISSPPPDTSAVNFTGYDPYQFYRIRRASGVSEREFINAFSETVKERLQDGGASGAFFFFSKGERFMAKSCSEAELLNIRRNVHTYASYFEKNPMSCIARIYGAFQLRIYSTSFYFYVMHNIFLTLDQEVVNEKYDIKGSWVNRNAAVPREGQVVTCSNCNQKFKYDPSQKAIKKANREAMKKGKTSTSATPHSSNDDMSRGTAYSLNLLNWFRGASAEDSTDEDGRSKRCLLTVTGKHEPNVVLKDNDLKHKLKIPRETAGAVLRQLRKDADLLCDEISVMDYSLLVGVHNTVYEVDEARDDSPVDNEKTFNSSGAWGTGDSSTDTPTRASLALKPRNRNPTSRFPVSAVVACFVHGNVFKITHIHRSVALLDLVRTTSASLIFSRSGHTVNRFVLALNINYSNELLCWTPQLERFVKTTFQGADPDGLSAIQPSFYKERYDFWFITRPVLIDITSRFLRRIGELLEVDTEGYEGSDSGGDIAEYSPPPLNRIDVGFPADIENSPTQTPPGGRNSRKKNRNSLIKLGSRS